MDGDNKKFTKQVEQAITVEDSDNKEKKEEVSVKQVTDDEIKKENKLLIVLTSIFVCLILVVTVLMFFVKGMLNPKVIIVPEVAGKTVSEVIRELQDAGFEVADEQMEISDESIAKDLVVKTNPASGSKRTKGTVVTIYVSTGDSKHEIEDYTGQNYIEVKAKLELEAYGIMVYIDKKEVDDPDKYDEETIIAQDKEPGSKLGPKDSITLTVPDIVTQYPDFTDGTYTVEDVQKFCDEYGVTLKINELEDSSYDEGTIIKQSRAKGYTVSSGTTLTITVAVAPTETECNPLDEFCETEEVE